MIVTPDNQAQASKQVSDPDAKVGLEVGPDEPPPTYSPAIEPVASGSDAASTPPLPTFKTKPTNLLALSDDQDSIRGEFVIDPSMYIPSSVLPPLGDDEAEDDRKNLCLKSKSGSVHAEIYLLGTSAQVGDKPQTQARRTTIALTSNHGSIRTQLHTLDNAAPFSLTANAPHGSVHLWLPRSFQGLFALSTRHGSITLSDALIQNATQLSQLGDMRRYFVGDIALLGDEAWEGDQVEIDSTHGSIRVRYVDEAVGQGGQKKKGLLSRLFGM